MRSAILGCAPIFKIGPEIDQGYDGFPIQKVTFQNGKPSERMELKSITRTSFTDADFSLGTAKKLEIPIPAAPKGKQRPAASHMPRKRKVHVMGRGRVP
jgi:hypothetical protein